MTVGSDKLRLLRRIPSVRFDEEMRGYSKSQVDRVLETLAPLADEIESLQNQLDDANQRLVAADERMEQLVADERPAGGDAVPDDNFDETLRNTLLLAQRTADQTIRDAESNAENLRRESTAKADSIMASARAEAKELKAEAHAQREQMLADAEAERAQLLADALEHAEARKQAIEDELVADQGAKRDELLGEISELERTRDDLAADVARFESYLNDRRQGVRTALAEITSVLEDPELLAESEAPDPAEVGIIEDLTEVTVTSHSISTLETEVAAARDQASEYGQSETVDEADEDGGGAPGEESPWDDSGVAEPGAEVDGEEPVGIADVDDEDHGREEPDAATSEPWSAEPEDETDTWAGPDAFESPAPAEADPFATAGFVSEEPAGIPATPSADSIYASVPETADPSAYPTHPVTPEAPGVSDPAGLGIDIEAPVAEPDPARSGMGSLAEQARSRLASRVSRLRDTAVPEDGPQPHDDPPPPLVGGDDLPPPPDVPVDDLPPPPVVAAEAPPPPVTEPSMWATPPAPEAPVELEADEWTAPSVEDPSRPLHPDARFEELPPDDPFLDELRQMTGGESPAEDDETLHKFLAEDGEKGESGGWFGRRR